MFGKLKEAASGGVAKKVVDAIAPQLNEHLEKVSELDPQKVNDDDFFTEKVSEPSLIAISAASSGVTKLIPGFDDKFKSAMIHIRNELVIAEEASIKLVDDFKERLPEVLLASLKA